MTDKRHAVADLIDDLRSEAAARITARTFARRPDLAVRRCLGRTPELIHFRAGGISVTTRRPAADEYAESYAAYVSLVPETDVLAAFEEQRQNLAALAESISEEKSLFRYAPEKWSIRQLIRHLADGERVFSYRALTFARESGADLPGFEENEWAAVAPADDVPFADLVAELVHLRSANVLMLRHLREEEWDRRGKASGYEITVRALVYAMVGHTRHHLRTLEDRYLAA